VDLCNGFFDELSKLGMTFRQHGLTEPGERKHLADALRKYNKYWGPKLQRGELKGFKKIVSSVAKDDPQHTTPIAAHDVDSAMKNMRSGWARHHL